DFVAKPAVTVTVGRVMEELIAKVKVAAGSRVPLRRLVERKRPLAPPTPSRLSPLGRHDVLLVVGSSTGGPRALYEVIPALPADLPAAVIVVQHMPPGFTRSLANRLDQASPLRVKEAGEEDSLLKGQVLVAPGGHHLLVEHRGKVALGDGPTVNGVRPAIDVTMQSVAELYGPRVVGVILTGMGRDGTDGAIAVKKRGGKIISEDESTCVVYGMPKSVAESGATDLIVPLPQVASEAVRMILNKMR
ncbi:MAG: chemotaxis response regulator protein-glutamate methylesterase, partial [Chloroflexi bacterium]|nr:chemotaxis response regulator protein-glutamate methylesterase [Chloroflexota bacterium]